MATEMQKVIAKEAIAQKFHDWYINRWNDYYADSDEPGWMISKDVAQLLAIVAPNVTSQMVQMALNTITAKV